MSLNKSQSRSLIVGPASESESRFLGPESEVESGVLNFLTPQKGLDLTGVAYRTMRRTEGRKLYIAVITMRR